MVDSSDVILAGAALGGAFLLSRSGGSEGPEIPQSPPIIPSGGGGGPGIIPIPQPQAPQTGGQGFGALAEVFSSQNELVRDLFEEVSDRSGGVEETVRTVTERPDVSGIIGDPSGTIGEQALDAVEGADERVREEATAGGDSIFGGIPVVDKFAPDSPQEIIELATEGLGPAGTAGTGIVEGVGEIGSNLSAPSLNGGSEEDLFRRVRGADRSEGPTSAEEITERQRRILAGSL